MPVRPIVITGEPVLHRRAEPVTDFGPDLQSLIDDMLTTQEASNGVGLAAPQIGVPGLHPHQLRHSAASLAITSEAGVKVVQRMLGHASATMTLDAYGHFFEDRLDEVGTALDIAQQSTQEAHQE